MTPPKSLLRRPKRIQLSRAKGWRKPEGAIVCARPSRWGNPYRIGDDIEINGGTGAAHPLGLRVDAALAVALHRKYILETMGLGEIRAALGGHDLCCWCPLDQPCHCDTLLDLANPRPNITITVNNPGPSAAGMFGGFPPGMGGAVQAGMVGGFSIEDDRRALAIRQQQRGMRS